MFTVQRKDSIHDSERFSKQNFDTAMYITEHIFYVGVTSIQLAC